MRFRAVTSSKLFWCTSFEHLWFFTLMDMEKVEAGKVHRAGHSRSESFDRRNQRKNRQAKNRVSERVENLTGKPSASDVTERNKVGNSDRSFRSSQLHHHRHHQTQKCDSELGLHSVMSDVEGVKTDHGVSNVREGSHKARLGSVCGPGRHSKDTDTAAGSTPDRGGSLEHKGQSKKYSRGGRNTAKPGSYTSLGSSLQEKRTDRSWRHTAKHVDSLSRHQNLLGQESKRMPMIPCVEQIFKAYPVGTLLGSRSSKKPTSPKLEVINKDANQPLVVSTSPIMAESETSVDLNKSLQSYKTNVDLEEGEIVDQDVTDFVSGSQRKTRKRRNSKKHICESAAASSPKRFVNKGADISEASGKLSRQETKDTCFQISQERGPVHSDISQAGKRSPAVSVGQFENRKESQHRSRSKVKNCEKIEPVAAKTDGESQQPVIVKQGTNPASVQRQTSPVVLEDGELLSDSSANSEKVLPATGSDMSISSDDSSSALIEYEDSSVLMVIRQMRKVDGGDTEHSTISSPNLDTFTGKVQSSSNIDRTIKVPTTEASLVPKALDCRLNPSAPSFIPKCCLPAAEEASTVLCGDKKPEISVQPMWLSNTWASADQRRSWGVSNPQSGFISAVACGSFTPWVPSPNMQASTSMACSSVFPSQHQSHVAGTSCWQPPSSNPSGSTPWTASGAEHSVCHVQTDQPVSCRMYSSQASTRRIQINLSGEQTCPEMTGTPRHWHTVKTTDAEHGSLEFTVMSYNILSQQLLEQHRYLYDECTQEDLDWAKRGAAIIRQIVAHSADIVCLQEVQEDHWTQDIRDILAGQGYHSVYKKQTGCKPDGCAILFKDSKFTQLKVIPVEFRKGGILDRENIGLILLLQPRLEVYKGSVKKICVATTHLLFNPRRGDVKLAQLMLFLAEIDKYAYVEDAVIDGGCTGAPDVNRNSEKVEPHDQKGHEVDENADKQDGKGDCRERPPSGGCSQNSVERGSTSQAAQHYCPIILCGDFNSEPFSDLYKFVTTGYLKYDDLIARFVCGQKEGMQGGTDRKLGKFLLPEHLSISETCQYTQVLKERLVGDESKRANQCPKLNSGHAFHNMNFQSVYTHFVNAHVRRKREVSTHHNRCSTTVDYIFYSKCRHKDQCKHQTDEAEFDCKTGPTTGHSHMDKSQSGKDSAIHASSSRKTDPEVPQTLELLARYRLMTDREVTKCGFMPNSILPSDHLCLIARFLLR